MTAFNNNTNLSRNFYSISEVATVSPGNSLTFTFDIDIILLSAAFVYTSSATVGSRFIRMETRVAATSVISFRSYSIVQAASSVTAFSYMPGASNNVSFAANVMSIPENLIIRTTDELIFADANNFSASTDACTANITYKYA